MRSKMIDEEKLCKIKSSLVEARSSFEGTEESDDGWALCNYLRRKLAENFQVRMENGCSKYVLYFIDYPFVLKMDSIDSDGNRGGECEREVELYKKAVELGLEKFFPKTELFCYLGDTPIVIQEKVDFADCNIPSAAKVREIERIARSALHQKLCYKIMNYLRENADFRVRSISSRWLSACVRLYGKKTVFELEKFIIDNRINDLHGNNVGWLNSKPVILDFSGYWRSSD